jgi:hypothetical protein
MQAALLSFLILQPANSLPAEMTDTKVQSMGRSKFVEWYTTKYGSSTMAMCDAETLYGDVIARHNNNAIRQQTSATRTFFAAVRKPLKDFSMKLWEATMCATGGGTMWQPIIASVHPDVEELLRPISNGLPLHSQSRVISDVTKLYPTFEAMVKQYEKENPNTEGYYTAAQARMVFGDAKKQFDVVVGLLKTRPRSESDHLLNYMKREIELASKPF